MRILFIRHGEPNYARDCLTAVGRLQAQAAAERLRDEGIQEIWSSPLGRAMETARIAAERLGFSEIGTLDFLREIRWGSADGNPLPSGSVPLISTGHPWSCSEEMMRLGWDMTRRDWTDHELFRNNLASSDARAVGRGTEAWLSELGYVRERSGYRCLRQDDAQRTIAVFGHEGSTVSALAQILQLPFPYLCCTLHLPYTGITVVRLPREPGSVGMPYLELVSDGRHIRDIPQDPANAPYPPTDWS